MAENMEELTEALLRLFDGDEDALWQAVCEVAKELGVEEFLRESNEPD